MFLQLLVGGHAGLAGGDRLPALAKLLDLLVEAAHMLFPVGAGQVRQAAHRVGDAAQPGL